MPGGNLRHAEFRKRHVRYKSDDAVLDPQDFIDKFHEFFRSATGGGIGRTLEPSRRFGEFGDRY